MYKKFNYVVNDALCNKVTFLYTLFVILIRERENVIYSLLSCSSCMKEESCFLCFLPL